MSTNTTAVKESAEEAVLRALKKKEQRPFDLLERLAERGYSSFEIKHALSELLYEARIELTPQRMLRTL